MPIIEKIIVCGSSFPIRAPRIEPLVTFNHFVELPSFISEQIENEVTSNIIRAMTPGIKELLRYIE
jgi:hypothetical protein